MMPKNTIAYPDVLEEGFILHWYEIKNVLGRGSFGVTYLAWDKNLNQQVAIKEYFPRDFSSRNNGSTVHPSTGESCELFEWGLSRFIREAQTLAKFKHHNIVRVMSVFELNNTAYMVMEYEEGEDLSSLYKQQKNFSEQALLGIFLPILNGLKLVHNAGFTHRDIKPANIYIRSDGSPVLIDFGSARKTTGAVTHTITSLVTHGYAPFEQYNESDDKQGAWTDIYALGACLYCAINGNSPLGALTRGSNFISNGCDGYKPLSTLNEGNYSKNFLLAVDNALLFQVLHRPQDVLVWADMLSGKVFSPALPRDDEVTVVKENFHNITPGLVIDSSRVLLDENIKNIKPNVSSFGFHLSFKKTKKIAIAFGTIIFIGSVIIFYLNGVDVKEASNNTNKAQLIVLLKSADNARRAGKLIETEDSAIYLYQKALKLDAENSEADSRIRDILEHYNGVIKRDFNAGYYEKARINVELLLATDIDTENLTKLKREIEKASEKAIEKKQAIDELLQLANDSLNNNKIKIAEFHIKNILDIDPDSQAALHLRAKINLNNQYIKNKLNQAKQAFDLGNIVNPKNKNALEMYKDVLNMDTENLDAKNGVIEIKKYFNNQFDKNLKVGNFKSAKKIILKVEKYIPEIQLINYMRKALNDKKNNYTLKLKSINKIIDKFKKLFELKNIEELKKISQFKKNREQFLKQFFENYTSFKLKSSNIKYIINKNKGTAKILLFDLVNVHGNVVNPGAWGKFKIIIRKSKDEHWKIYW